jgi:hypothetical protein
MWPFKKGSAEPPSAGKDDDLVPPDEMRRMLAREDYMIEGPFPIREPGEGGHLLCKNCGAAYRDFTWERAAATLVEALREEKPGCKVVIVTCAGCSRTSAFSPKDIVTLKPEDSFGPWTIQDVFLSIDFYKRVDADLPQGIPDLDRRIAQVLNMNPAPL